MTRAELTHRIIVRDVDLTIQRWQGRGVTTAMVGAQLRCQRNWPTIRRVMIAIEDARTQPAVELRRAA